MLSHLTFMHSFVQNYIICYGSDGHIQIENVNDCGSCENHPIFESAEITISYLSSTDCNDVSLDENCLDDAQFFSKNKITINAGNQKNNIFIFRSGNHKRTLNKIDTITFGNNILENYTTVSLII